MNFLCFFVFLFSFYKYIVNSKKNNNIIVLLKKDKARFTFMILSADLESKNGNGIVIYDLIAEPVKNTIYVVFGYSQIMFNLLFQ